MTDKKISAEVSVSKAGPNGRPQAQVLVDPGVSAANLGALLQKVVTNENVLKAAGLRACLGCKSGLDINILDGFQEIIKVEV